MADNDNKAISSPYTKYQLNMDATDFKDLITLEHNEYIQKHFRPNSCLLTAIINKFYNRFNVIKSDGKRAHKELTYSYLCDLLEIPNEKANIAVSINQIVEKVFKRFAFLNLYVYSPYMKLLFKHISPNQNTSTSLRIIIKGKHVYEINDKVRELQQMPDNEDDERHTLVVGDKYRVIEKKESEETKEVYCIDIDDIFKTIKESAKIETLSKLCIITPENMNTLLIKIIESGYTPKVSFHCFLYRINIYSEKLLISIETCDNSPLYGQQVVFDSIEEYKAYNTAYDTLYKSVIKQEHVSDSHDSVVEVEKAYPIRPLLGHFGKQYNTSTFETIDENKAYTECLQSIKEIPKFNYFDVYVPYDNHAIEDLTYYVIEVLENTKESIILFGNKIARTYGYVLKACNIKYAIKYFRRPLSTEQVDYKTPIETLYKNENVCTNMKKMIVNKITGMLELKKNKASLSKVFEDYNEAYFYSVKYEGKILPVITQTYSEKKVFSDIDNEYIMRYNSTQETHYYLVNVHEEKELVNGLCPIKDMIYQNQRLKMYNLYKKLNALKIEVLGCKTDCFYYIGSRSTIEKRFPITNKIGDFKIEEHKYLPENKLILEQNELIKIVDYTKVDIKTFEDEKDTVNINKYITCKKQLLIKGQYPGVGKSTLCKNFDDDSLFILPYNRLCQNLKTEGYDAITFSRAFGLFKNDIELKTMKQYDLSEYNTIVFDEALLYTPERLKRLDTLIRMFPNKTFLSTGDTDQRNPIGFENEKYLAHCMNVIFRNQVVLKDIKRLVNTKDIQRWKDLKVDIFNNTMSIQDICKKHRLNTVHSMSEVKTEKNVCYFNFRCDVVNHHVHKNILKKEQTYYPGLEIVCRKYEKSKGLTLNTNYIYKIKSIGKDVVITDEIDEIDYKITKPMLTTHFKLPYALTADSVQGMSFGDDEKCTVFDSNLPYADRKFIWTAITRCRKLDNVFIYIHSDKEVESFTESKTRQYFRFKCDNYKIQDKNANREWEKVDYIDEPWIKAQIEKYGTVCKFCNKNMELYVDESGNVQSNLTVDRIDSSKPHITSNCQLMCNSCNCSKGNRY